MSPASIDIRVVPPAPRHALIFTTFDGLPTGAAFEIVNDHDPQPLRRQFEATRPGQFEWHTLAAGPSLWQVRIARLSAGAPVADAQACCACSCRGG